MFSDLRGVSSWLSSSSGSLSHSHRELRFLFLHSQLCLFPAHCLSTASSGPRGDDWKRLPSEPMIIQPTKKHYLFSHVTKLVNSTTDVAWQLYNQCISTWVAPAESLKITQFKHCMGVREWSQVTGGEWDHFPLLNWLNLQYLKLFCLN